MLQQVLNGSTQRLCIVSVTQFYFSTKLGCIQINSSVIKNKTKRRKKSLLLVLVLFLSSELSVNGSNPWTSVCIDKWYPSVWCSVSDHQSWRWLSGCWLPCGAMLRPTWPHSPAAWTTGQQFSQGRRPSLEESWAYGSRGAMAMDVVYQQAVSEVWHGHLSLAVHCLLHFLSF